MFRLDPVFCDFWPSQSQAEQAIETLGLDPFLPLRVKPHDGQWIIWMNTDDGHRYVTSSELGSNWQRLEGPDVARNREKYLKRKGEL